VKAFILGKDQGLITTAEMGNGKELEEVRDTVSE